MPASEIRKDAREALSGKWGKAICIILVYFVFAFVIGLIQSSFKENSTPYFIIELITFIISIPLSFGLIISFMKLKRDESVSCVDFFKDGFANFGRSWGLWFHTFIRLLLPIVCLVLVVILMAALFFTNVINGSAKIGIGLILLAVGIYIASLVYIISRAFLYSLVYNIAYDNPELSSKECVLKSEALMKGNRGNLFLLELSFIGWAILAVFTLCIGYLWLAPYMMVALVCFYERVANNTKTENSEEDIKTEE